ncbi:hypothetical protein [Vibrio maritimus]|uniref:hypothetical protein n=1 Tax=Vibrio maritimus TaxID=990268 RepID=UPI001F25A12E|nr:hypothetical protein [Vibrio maritimus]
MNREDVYAYYSLTGDLGIQLLGKYKKVIIYKALASVVLLPVIVVLEVLSTVLVPRKRKDCVCALGQSNYNEVSQKYDVDYHLGLVSFFSFFIRTIKAGNRVYCYDKYCILFFIDIYFTNSLTRRFLLNLLQRSMKRRAYSILLVGNDTKPNEKVHIIVARMLDIKSYVYQHGVWTGRYGSPYELDGWHADFLYVFDEKNKQVAITHGLDECRILSVGYPRRLFNYQSKPICINNPKICILGAAAHRSSYSEDIEELMRKLVMSLGSNYVVDYKPHPVEFKDNSFDIDEKLVSKVLPKSCSMHEVIGAYDVFISIGSTALIETSAAGKIAIQIYSDRYASLDMSESTACYRVNVDDILRFMKGIPNNQSKDRKIYINQGLVFDV